MRESDNSSTSISDKVNGFDMDYPCCPIRKTKTKSQREPAQRRHFYTQMRFWCRKLLGTTKHPGETTAQLKHGAGLCRVSRQAGEQERPKDGVATEMTLRTKTMRPLASAWQLGSAPNERGRLPHKVGRMGGGTGARSSSSNSMASFILPLL